MTVLAIDPGSEQSAFVLFDGEMNCIAEHGKVPNGELEESLRMLKWTPHIVIERIASYGMAVGAEVFETCVWTGRFMGAVGYHGTPCHRLPRKDVKLHLCGQTKAKDSNIRQALIDRFGGKEKAIGKKANQGPLYGLKADTWQALALAVTWLDLHGTPSTPQEDA
jgi:hypothetical protein